MSILPAMILLPHWVLLPVRMPINMLAGETGIRLTEDDRISPSPFYASLVDSSLLHNKFSMIDNPARFTRFEQLAICSLKSALAGTEIAPSDPGTLFILSTTKGNIDLLENSNRQRFGEERAYLWNTAQLIRRLF